MTSNLQMTDHACKLTLALTLVSFQMPIHGSYIFCAEQMIAEVTDFSSFTEFQDSA